METGLLVVQLGTPDAPTAKALRPYLREFLNDKRVIGDINPVLWWLILNLFILPFRPARSAKAYQKVWRSEGSPLFIYAKAVTQYLAREFSGRLPVELGMRYGNPSILSAMKKLVAQGARHMIVLPLFPQYCSATSGSVLDGVQAAIKQLDAPLSYQLIDSYFDDSGYLQSLAEIVNTKLQAAEREPEYLIFSFHGIPATLIRSGDPYTQQCEGTIAALKPLLHFPADRILLAYHSRFGNSEWAQPYLEDTLQKLLDDGVKRVAIACPGFVADCLETIGDIDIKTREEFMAGGGEELLYLPCLNDSPTWLEALKRLAENALAA